MLKSLFVSIPNEIYYYLFVLNIFGLILFVWSNRAKRLIWILVILLAFSFFWRIAIRINSSRYAVLLILPSIYFGCYLICRLNLTPFLFIKLISWILLIVLAIVFLYKDFRINHTNYSVYEVSETINRKERSNNQYYYSIPGEEYFRIYSNKYDEKKFSVSPSQLMKLNTFLQNQAYINAESIVFFQTKEDYKKIQKELTADSKFIALFHTKYNSQKKICAILKKHSGFFALKKRSAKELPSNNLLINGDLELVDSPEQSYNKFRGHIPQYSNYFDVSPSRLTPQNAYFHSVSDLSSNPIFTVIDSNTISGKHSALISFKEGLGYLFYNQRFSEGNYVCSLDLRGSKETIVSVITNFNINNKWTIQKLGFLSIPDSRTYTITIPFSVDKLNSSDYFIFGVSVRNGMAVFDNFQISNL